MPQSFMRKFAALFIFVPWLLTAQGRGTAPAAPGTMGRESVRENYSKFEYRVPMRDGVKLFTSVYIPEGRKSRTTKPIRS